MLQAGDVLALRAAGMFSRYLNCLRIVETDGKKQWTSVTPEVYWGKIKFYNEQDFRDICEMIAAMFGLAIQYRYIPFPKEMDVMYSVTLVEPQRRHVDSLPVPDVIHVITTAI
jgi:hypothetical protein